MRRLRVLLAVVALFAATACTPAQVRAWLRWHRADPDAAVAFLDTDVGRELLADDGSDEPQFAQWLTPTPGDCGSYAPLLELHGLPVATFTRIAWRESGCNHRSFVIDADDAGGGLLGINLKGSLAATWHSWCGVTLGSVIDADTNIRCAAEAYRRLGLRPWS